MFTISVEQMPHPTAAVPNHRRGGNSLEAITAGTWKSTWTTMDTSDSERIKIAARTNVGEEKGREDPVIEFPRGIPVKGIFG